MLSDSKLLANLSYRKIPEAATIYLEYQRRCKRANAMDFDDLLLNTYHLLKKAPEVRRNYQERYKYIFVDEYQDTNRIQHEIIKLLKNPEGEVTVVGDDAQSIYSFRGAVIENILRFPDSFPGAHLFKLTKNYRSTSNIVELANGLIAKNRKRIPKEIVAVADKGKKVLLMNAFTAQMEAQQVAAMISKLVKDGENPDEIAVLYRNNAQSRLLEDFLRMFKVEIRIVGGLSFYDRKEVKDLLAYLRLILNPNDDEAFRRIYNFPTRGIGATTFEKLAQLAKESEQPLMTVASSPQLLQAIKGAGAKKVQDFVALIAEMAGKQHDMEPDAYLKYVIRASGIAQQYSDGTVDSESRMENINELVNALADHMNRQKEMDDESPTLEGFIREMALYTDQDKNEDNSKPKVTLMTMHSSKGLEYNHVFCTGLESGIIPSQRSYSEAEVEEERRLLYVAITRAKKECVLSFARERMLYGKTNTAEPSIFLYDLNPEYVQDTSGILTKKPDVLPPHGTSAPSYTAEPKKVTTRIVRRKEKVKEEPLTTSEIGNYKVGDIVFHDKFGCGTIQSIDNSITGEKLTIRFEKEGVKQLLTKFAKLRKSN